MKFTGERVVEGLTPRRIWLDHIERYKFSNQYVDGKIVLDISCGTGYGSKILYEAGAYKVIGIDISNEAINFVQNKYNINGVEFIRGDILNINFRENYFDLITCFETIEHVREQEKALRELLRVLKPEGLIIISSPNRNLTSPKKSINDNPDNIFHYKEYSTKEYIDILKVYFEVLEIYGQRPINKLFLQPIFKRITRKIMNIVFSIDGRSSRVNKISFKKEYRYITAVCKKRDN